MILWVSRPLYELLPYFYVLVGGITITAGVYVNYWHWLPICTVAGIVSIATALVVSLKRRRSRYSD
jgi:hypothetical protein